MPLGRSSSFGLGAADHRFGTIKLKTRTAWSKTGYHSSSFSEADQLVPRNIRFRILTVGHLKSDVSGGTNEVIRRSVAPQFLQKKRASHT